MTKVDATENPAENLENILNEKNSSYLPLFKPTKSVISSINPQNAKRMKLDENNSLFQEKSNELDHVQPLKIIRKITGGINYNQENIEKVNFDYGQYEENNENISKNQYEISPPNFTLLSKLASSHRNKSHEISADFENASSKILAIPKIEQNKVIPKPISLIQRIPPKSNENNESPNLKNTKQFTEFMNNNENSSSDDENFPHFSKNKLTLQSHINSSRRIKSIDFSGLTNEFGNNTTNNKTKPLPETQNILFSARRKSADLPKSFDKNLSKNTQQLPEIPLINPLLNGGFGLEKIALCYRELFPFDKFNKIQSECFPLLYESDQNCVVSAPTGSGKTVLFELAICRLYKNLVEDCSIGSMPASEVPRTIYIAPMKALCQERSFDWRARFQRVGIRVVELTGDTEDSMLGEVSHGHILLTTPEKWDAFTRGWKDHKKLVQGVKLLLIDEVHLLNTDRGATLEAVVARMQSIATLGGQKLRIIAQSATIPNIEDLCEWLHVKPEIGLKKFGEEYRPIKLQKYVLGFPPASNEFTFERALNFKLSQIIKQYSSRRPTLVFCQTQKGTAVSATKLKDDLDPSYLIDSPQQRTSLIDGANRIKDKALQSIFFKEIMNLNRFSKNWNCISSR